MFPALAEIWAFSTADIPSTRSINLGHNSRLPQYSQYQQYPECRTEAYNISSTYMNSTHYPQIELNTDT